MNGDIYRPVTWRQALDMCEDIESRRRLGKWEQGIVNQAYEMALSGRDLTPLLSERIEIIYFGKLTIEKEYGT